MGDSRTIFGSPGWGLDDLALGPEPGRERSVRDTYQRLVTSSEGRLVTQVDLGGEPTTF